MSDIGGVAVDIVRGIPQGLKLRVDAFDVMGVDGVGAQTLGLGDAEFNLTTIAYVTSNVNANALIDSFNALQGTVVTITDDWGDVYPNILVKHVDSEDAKKPCVYKGNPNYVRVEVKWQMVTSS